MDRQQEQDRFFETVRIANEVELFPADGIYKALGYEQTESSDVVSKFKQDWKKTLDMFDKRAEFRPPNIVSLKKSGEPYLALEFDEGTKIIVRPELEWKFVPARQHQVGNRIENVLIRDNDDYIDLLTVIPRRSRVASYLSFYSHGLHVGETESQESFVYLPVKWRADSTSWDTSGFRYVLLHELSHEQLRDIHSQKRLTMTHEEIERQTNANALQITRQLQKRFPDKHFLDTGGQAEWIENQLRRNDPDDIYRQEEVPEVASNFARKIVRNKRRSVT